MSATFGSMARNVRRGSRAATLAMVLLLAAIESSAAARAADPVTGPPATAARPSPDPIAHDPTVIRQGRYHYEIITGDSDTRTYLPIRRSTDLVHWTLLGTVFDTPPAWVAQELGTAPGDFWAPDVNFFDGEYHLYYAASSFGTNNSVIGLATNVTLDPADPRYRWVDRGMVIRSRTTDDFNAIDADVVFDGGGVPWMSFGSFWDGIKMRRLDAATGLLSAADPTLYPLASRGGAAIEGPSIVRNGGYYYLFASFDFCCRGVNSDYRVVVGRAASVTGPYLDRAGVPMLAGGGTELLRGYNGFRGPGGGDVYRQADGPRRRPDLYVHHYYDAADGGRPKGSVRTISWQHGWPVLSDPVSGNRGFGSGGAYVRIAHRASGAVLTNDGCGYEGADIRLAAGAPADACRQWRLEDRGEGSVSILNRHSNKVAEVAACVDAEGARVAQWGWLDNDCQKFGLVPTADGWSRIESRLAGRVLAPASCAGAGAAVQTFTWLADACQQFRLDPVGDVLIADAANRRLLDASGCAAPGGPARGLGGAVVGADAGGAAVVASGRRTGTCQLWRFVRVDGGYFAVVHQRSGRPLTVLGPPGGAGRVVLGRPGAAGPGAQWRIEPREGAYRLVSRDGRVIRLGAGGVSLAPLTGDPGGDLAGRVLLLTP